ncbi:globin domain-containing protein [Streptomyces ipomoeae]|nr:globin domain-containing protein [Streptomyces ipomoeae]MDX2699476.1 globin domain-containing protein [Streptomyces ipomoeae]MDX2824170.1 globin domain-containing protein [Streptomyces ipomoeae]MDX2845142.1 globin domain-containing protein [Streptomyces ipomoeae]MDX2876792.1 globin domain-containing protein [Streptomyces ipomoeae]MDX2932526.1 globin domain-containing protein [Streptomyces ipomoeae]
MLEARHTMDAPTTTSAGNGTSGDSDGGGWFTPRTQPQPPGGAEEPEGNRLAALRPMGRPQEPLSGPQQDRDDVPGERIPAPEEPPPSALPHPRQGPTGDEYGTEHSAHGSERSLFEGRVPVQQEPRAPEPSPDAVLIRRTMAEVGPVADKVTSYFYALLFVQHPELRSLFPPAMDAQRDRLLKALLTAAEHIDNTPVLVDYLQNLGRGHRKYGTRAEHYPAVGECLIGALSRYTPESWNDETEAAWVRAYTTISQVMIDAAAADELHSPPWWMAEVVSHEMRTSDIAVITVRPNQPYPFLAGQYTSLETPWWPRIWRHYSFASAPRSDGLLSFHVKAISAGWVSNSLVHRARPGDVLRLGPPAGAMTVDHASDSGLLCLGGGTGIAPIKAMVEDVAERGRPRPVEVFYGARTSQDLYDIDTLLRLRQSNPWLEIRPVVDKHGLLRLPDAIREYGPWNEYDAYLSGPPGMIRSGVDALRGAGVPSERIRHDSVEELVAAGN